MRRGFLIGGCFIMKISRRSVLHISGLAAAALALTGCSAAGSAALGGKLPGLLKGLAKKGETAASSEAASDMAVTPPPEGEELDPAFGVMPEYDADILTGAERSTNSRPVAVMVNNIANSQRQNARPQRGIGSADLLIEAKVEGGITRLCAVFSDADSIPEVGPIRSGRSCSCPGTSSTTTTARASSAPSSSACTATPG